MSFLGPTSHLYLRSTVDLATCDGLSCLYPALSEIYIYSSMSRLPMLVLSVASGSPPRGRPHYDTRTPPLPP
jgi:hypothetical protein